MDREGATRFLQQIDQLWIQPEIENRRREGRLPDGFVVRQALIKLPPGGKPIVRFNEEIVWSATIKLPPNVQIDKGRPVYMHHIEKVETVDAPTHEGRPVAFIYLWYRGFGNYQILSDFSANHGDIELPEGEWPYGKIVAESLQEIIEEHIIKFFEPNEQQLARIGLWAARRIVPYPLSEIVRLLSEGNDEGAVRCFVGYFVDERLVEIFESWRSNPLFVTAWPVFESALASIKHANFIGAVYTLIPQVEGLISSYLYNVLPEEQVPFRGESKAKKFVQVLAQHGPRLYATERMMRSLSSFLLDGPVQSTFTKWLQDLNTSFPNRHAITHGRFDPQVFTRENLLKLVLLIDSIFELTKPTPQPSESAS